MQFVITNWYLFLALGVVLALLMAGPIRQQTGGIMNKIQVLVASLGLQRLVLCLGLIGALILVLFPPWHVDWTPFEAISLPYSPPIKSKKISQSCGHGFLFHSLCPPSEDAKTEIVRYWSDKFLSLDLFEQAKAMASRESPMFKLEVSDYAKRAGEHAKLDIPRLMLELTALGLVTLIGWYIAGIIKSRQQVAPDSLKPRASQDQQLH